MILGTAGHIDHGKTALVKALTGVDTDRLPEEKRRGITIDLGFAPLAVEGGDTIGIVDVPGHEAFIRTMLAGASGIDIALLVIASDEGVMPQTREHLDILSLLGIPKVVVALTKSDLVSEDWLALVVEDVRALLADTRYADSEIFSVSAVTGAGLPELREAIQRAEATGKTEAISDDLFRMPMDRAFTMKGTGTVVTGTVWTGEIGRDETVMVFPPGKHSRVRGVQHHGKPVGRAASGERIALALSDLEVAEVGRGSVVVSDRAWRPTSRIEAEIRIISDEIEIGSRTRLRFHLGTSDVGARISGFSQSKPLHKEEFVATVVLDEPLLVRGGDRFVLRQPSPAATIGGGIVRDPYPLQKRRRGGRAAGGSDPSERHVGETRGELLTRMAHDAGIEGLEVDTLPIRTGLPISQATRLAEDLGLVAIRARFHAPSELHALEAQAERLVREHAENFPLDAGVQLQSLRAALHARETVIQWVVDRLVEDSKIEVDQSVARPFGWTPSLTSRERALADAVLHAICIKPEEPPAVSELAGSFGQEVRNLVRYLERTGELVRVSDDRYYSPVAVGAMLGKLRSSLEPFRIYSPGELREVLGVSRKYLIPFLEFCDRAGITDRKAEGRVISAPGTVPASRNAMGDKLFLDTPGGST